MFVDFRFCAACKGALFVLNCLELDKLFVREAKEASSARANCRFKLKCFRRLTEQHLSQAI